MDLECSALNSTAVEFKYKPKQYKYDIETFLYHEGRIKVLKTLQGLMKGRHQNVKLQLSLQIQISKLQDDESVTISPWFNSETHTVYSADT